MGFEKQNCLRNKQLKYTTQYVYLNLVFWGKSCFGGSRSPSHVSVFVYQCPNTKLESWSSGYTQENKLEKVFILACHRLSLPGCSIPIYLAMDSLVWWCYFFVTLMVSSMNHDFWDSSLMLDMYLLLVFSWISSITSGNSFYWFSLLILTCLQLIQTWLQELTIFLMLREYLLLKGGRSHESKEQNYCYIFARVLEAQLVESSFRWCVRDWGL